MSFANDVQRGRVCAVLTSWIPGAPHWVADESGVPRPTDHAMRVIGGKVPCSSSERAMMRIALDVWNGHGEGTFASALHLFDRRNLAMVGALLVAVADRSEAVNRWLAEYSR
jgi:hypothetical protein